MAQGRIPDGTISWAIETLIRLTDDDIQRHREKMQQLVTRITQVTRSPSERAETILQIARENLNTLMDFFRKDHTNIIRQFNYSAGSDPRTAVLSVRNTNKKPLQLLLLRLLACRYFAVAKRQLELGDESGGPGQKRPRPKRHGKGRLLLRTKGLPTNHQTEDALKRGEKALTIEDSLEVPEISLVLLHSLSKLNHLYSIEARRLVEIFSNYPELKDACRSLNERRLLSDYQSFYNDHVDTLFLASQERSDVLSKNGSESSH